MTLVRDDPISIRTLPRPQAGNHHRAGQRPRLRPQPGRRPPRRQTGQRDDRSRRPVEDPRLRHCVRRRLEHDAGGHAHGHAELHVPRAGGGAAVDRRSDIFLVGLVFYELLAYRQAFSGETIHHVLAGIVHGEPIPIAEACPGLDPAIAAILGRAIRKKPEERYQTLAEFTADLATVGAQSRTARVAWEDSTATTVVTPPPAPPTPAGGREHQSQSSVKAPGREKWAPSAGRAAGVRHRGLRRRDRCL